MRILISILLFLAVPVEAQPAVKREACVSIAAVGPGPHTAESYLYPLSLRAHIVRMVKEQMNQRGEYPHAIDHTFQPRFHEAVARRQAALGEPATGCLTWSVVRFYDPQKRTPPEN